MLTLSDCQTLDQEDPLAHFRDRFHLPENRLNFDGNSLGSLPRQTVERLSHCVRSEWGDDLIASWSTNGWFEAPVRVGNKLAPLIGADAGEVIISDSVSVNIFKALCAALSLNPERREILSESGNFPTDLYMMEGLAAFSRKLYPGSPLVNRVVHPDDFIEAISEETAVLLLTQVHYKTAEIKDLKTITARAHSYGVPVVWDLSHSVGSIPVDLNGAKADFAVGCGYKFLNGGPGAPAFLYVARRHQATTLPVLAGWMGHADPFAFTDDYRPAADIRRFRVGTPPILSLTALEAGIDLMREADIHELRNKALALSRLFIQLMEQECGQFGFRLVSPREDHKRGGHVSYFHEEGHGIYQAIKKKGIISDYRTPGVLRFGITPLYLRHVDVFHAVAALRSVMEGREWDREEYRERAGIT